jgi:hypothetical protein
MLYATDGIKTDDDFNKAMVGVASVWCVTIVLLGCNLLIFRRL